MASLHDASFYCITSGELPADDRGIYAKVSLSSACLGLCGSVAQLLFWRQSVDRNHASRRRPVSSSIAVCLALSNFMSCIGVLGRATGILLTKPPKQMDFVKKTDVIPAVSTNVIIIGASIEVFTNFMYSASVLWTLAYALDVYFRLRFCHFPDLRTPKSYMYHILCWGVAALSASGGTLAIWIDTDGVNGTCAGRNRLIWSYLFGYIPMVLVLFTNPFIYWRAHVLDNNAFRRRGRYTQEERDKQRMLRIRFLIIVLVFTACWLPNIADSIAELVVMTKKLDQHILFPVWMIEAILNPLQGLFNCILYRPGLVAFCNHRCGKNRDHSLQGSVEQHESRLLLGSRGIIDSFKRTYT